MSFSTVYGVLKDEFEACLAASEERLAINLDAKPDWNVAVE